MHTYVQQVVANMRADGRGGYLRVKIDANAGHVRSRHTGLTFAQSGATSAPGWATTIQIVMKRPRAFLHF